MWGDGTQQRNGQTYLNGVSKQSLSIIAVMGYSLCLRRVLACGYMKEHGEERASLDPCEYSSTNISVAASVASS
jgi:hypothetical protein